jgi:two-component system, NtrC family, sensor kinase
LGLVMPSEKSTACTDQSVEELRRELAAAREQQAATSELLKVIGRSTFDLKPVFEALADSAVRLCEAERSLIYRLDGDRLRVAASHNATAEVLAFLERNPMHLARASAAGRASVERRTIHIEDVLADPEYTYGATQVDPVRTVLAIPMLRGDELLGVIVIYRHEVRPFTTSQIALMETFADQAVIAIENTRLFETEQTRTKELQESLEYQTATSDVLEVISTSPNDVKPVLEAIASTSGRLCQADDAHIFLLSDGKHRLAAANNPDKEWVRILSDNPLTVDTPGSVTARAIREKRVVHIEDTRADPEHAEGLLSRQPRRTVISVPLLRGSRVVGAITLNRRTVSPFTPRQAALLETFADQAVIAIENTRLFEAEQASKRELQVSLEEQTATSEVLSAISNSPGELEPVFQAMLTNAVRICEAKFGNLLLCEGDGFRFVAVHGAPAAYRERFQGQTIRPSPKTPLARARQTRQVAHVADITREPAYVERDPPFVALADLAGARSLLIVPMMREDQVVGAIAIYRQEVRPFAEKQIELLRNFAKQAVIAIENTRLLNELRETLQQQTATADVLKVISRSAFDLQAVLDALVESAQRVCEADSAFIFRRQDAGYRRVTASAPNTASTCRALSSNRAGTHWSVGPPSNARRCTSLMSLPTQNIPGPSPSGGADSALCWGFRSCARVIQSV